MIYLIDSNTFMTAARTFYSFDYGTKFWDFIEVQAKNRNYTIVTFEQVNKNRKNKIPIPNVCDYYKIKYCDLFEMLRNLNFRL